MTEQFYVAIELARVGRNYVTTEDFWVATELATTESSTAHDRAGRVKVGAQYGAALCCDRGGHVRVTDQAWRV